MRTAAEIDRQRRGIVDRVARLVECGRMLDLNRSDGDLREPALGERKPGEIFYVLDTNVLKAFLQPLNSFDMARLFHNPLWTPNDKEKAADYGRLMETTGAQAILLATEFVLSSDMRGAEDRVLMSLPHLKELEGQMRRFGSDVRLDASRDRNYDIMKTQRRIKELIDLSGLPPEQALEQIKKDALFILPSVSRRRSEAELKRIRDDYVVSAICRALAEDRLLEPIEQVERLATDELWSRIHPLEWRFEASPDDRDEIAADEETWLDLLNEEFDRRLKRHKGRLDSEAEEEETRERDSLPADARTIAYLHWVARKRVGPRQRVVLITGDRLLLDAYRRRYAESKPGDSFLLRPLAQYAPQYNLRDARAPFAEDLAYFDRAREALETSTLPLAFTFLDHYREEVGRTSYHAAAKARDKFCVDALDRRVQDELIDALVPGKLPYNRATLDTQLDQLDALAEELRGAERLAVGALPHLVQNRVASAIARHAELATILESARDDDDARRIMAGWFAERQERALRKAFSFAQPLAVDHICEETADSATASRVPVALRLLLPHQGELLAAEDWLRKTTKEMRRKALASPDAGPALIFALASWFTFRRGLWSEATRFADLARQAADDGDSDSLKSIYHECIYLNALALRRRMASEKPNRNYDADVWRRDLIGIEKALKDAAEDGEEAMIVRSLRARSERASARLTYCAWAAVGDLKSLPPYRHDRLILNEILVAAVSDLKWVVARLPVARSQVKEGPRGSRKMRHALLDWVALQTSANRECARLVYDRLQRVADPFRGWMLLPPNPFLETVLNALDREEIALGELPMHTIILAYHLSAQGRAARAADDRAKVGKVREDIRALKLEEGSLALDHVMLDAIIVRAENDFDPPEMAEPLPSSSIPAPV